MEGPGWVVVTRGEAAAVLVKTDADDEGYEDVESKRMTLSEIFNL